MLASVTTLATIVGTSAHLITRSNRQEALNIAQMNETKCRKQEVDDMIAEYKSKLNTPGQSHRPVLQLQANRQALKTLNKTIIQASEMLPIQYLDHFQFNKIIPKAPKLIETHTEEINHVNLDTPKFGSASTRCCNGH